MQARHGLRDCTLAGGSDIGYDHSSGIVYHDLQWGFIIIMKADMWEFKEKNALS